MGSNAWSAFAARVDSILSEPPRHQLRIGFFNRWHDSDKLISVLNEAYAMSPERCIKELCPHIEAKLEAHPPILRRILVYYGDESSRPSGKADWKLHLPSLYVPFVKTLAALDEAASRAHPSAALGLDLSYKHKVNQRGAAALISAPGRPRLRHLSLHDNMLRLKGAQSVARWRLIEHLTSLDLSSCQLRGDAIEALLASSYWPRGLRALNLNCDKIGDGGLRALSHAEALDGLEHLDLYDIGLGRAQGGLAALLASERVARLKTLRLDCNDVRGVAIEALARGPNAGALEHLDLSGAYRLRADIAPLFEAPCARGLTHLMLRGTQLGARGVEALAASGQLQRLRALDLSGCALGDEGLRILASADLPALRVLQLERNDITGEGLRAVVGSRLFQGLEELSLKDNPISAAGLKALAGAPYTREWTYLDLEETAQTDAACVALLRSPRLAPMRFLTLYHHEGIGDPTAEALVGATHMRALLGININQRALSPSSKQRLRGAEHLQGIYSTLR